jgi:hypothetical protein
MVAGTVTPTLTYSVFVVTVSTSFVTTTVTTVPPLPRLVEEVSCAQDTVNKAKKNKKKVLMAQ